MEWTDSDVLLLKKKRKEQKKEKERTKNRKKEGQNIDVPVRRSLPERVRLFIQGHNIFTYFRKEKSVLWSG